MKIIALAVAASLMLAGCQRSSTVRDTEVDRWVLLDGAQLQLLGAVGHDKCVVLVDLDITPSGAR